MRPGSLEELINRTYPLKWKGRSRRWMVPSAGEPSSLVVDTKWQRFFWYARNLCGGTYVWRRDVLNDNPSSFINEAPIRFVRKVAPPPPISLVVQWHRDLAGSEAGRRYLLERGIYQPAIDHFLLGYSPLYGGSISIPHLVGLKVLGIKLRVIKPGQRSRYRAVAGSRFTLYNMNNAAGVIVEGEFKAVHLWQIGVEACSIQTAEGWNDDVIRLLGRRRYIYLRDNDRAGFLSAATALGKGLDLVVTSTPHLKAIDDYLLEFGKDTQWLQGLRSMLRRLK